MSLPFTAEEFFGVFARYNVAVWPLQVVLALAGLSAAFPGLAPSRGSDRVNR